MEFTLEQILDIPRLQMLQDKLNVITPFPSALIDTSGRILTATAWQDVCTKFLRVHPETEKECIASDRYINDHMEEANPAVTYTCPHGMVDNAIPIILEGRHLGNFFTGQLFLEPPDLEFFRAQAAEHGFDEEAYLEAVQRVPVWSHEKLNQYLGFMKTFVESLAQMGLDRLRGEEAGRNLELQEERFSRIIGDTRAGYFFIDKDGIFQDVNDSWVKLYKYSGREDVIGHHFIDVQRFEDADKAQEFVDHILTGDPKYLSGEFSRRCADGSIGYHSFSARPVMKEGVVIGLEGFIIDSTSQRLAEMERDQSRERLASVFNGMTEGFALHEIICDPAGSPINYRFLDVNPAFEVLTGLKAADILGKTAREIFPMLEPEWIDRYGKVALTAQPDSFEQYSRSQDRFFRVVAFSNRPGQFVTVFNDITGQRKAQEWLRTLAHAIDSINECVSMTDNENTILFVNRAFCNTYGYTQDELTGKNISLVRAVASQGPESAETILSQTLGGGWSGEVMNRKKDGTEFPVHISTAIVTNEKQEPIALIGIATDVTDRRRSQLELIAAKEQAEESDRLKSAFLANISHEIRTPMNSILGFSELLGEMVTDPEQLKYLQIISMGGERLLNIINSVIDIAKIEAGQVDLVIEAFDLNSLMRELYELNRRRKPDIGFYLHNPSIEIFVIESDKTKIFQILNNLIGNALKFTERGLVRFGFVPEPTGVQFFVEDTGIGIPPEYRQKVFERFRKVDIHSRTEYEGTGLGLAITRELVALLKGEIWFESEPDRGTRFFVRLPNLTDVSTPDY